MSVYPSLAVQVKEVWVIPNCLIKNGLQVSLSQGGALEIFMRSDVLRSSEGFVVGDGLHPLLAKALNGVGVLPQIELRADQDNGDVGSVMADLRVPLPRLSVVFQCDVDKVLMTKDVPGWS